MGLANTPETPRQLASQKSPKKLFCETSGSVMDGETGKMMDYRHIHISPQYKEVWGKLFGIEMSRLAQGMPGRLDGMNTLFFMDEEKIP